MTEEKKTKPVKQAVKYEKSELIKSRKWNRYTLEALLTDGEKYSIDEVERMTEKERKGE